VLSFGHKRVGSSHLNYSVYHDRYQRIDEIKCLDTNPAGGLGALRGGGLADGVEPSSAGSPGTSAMTFARPSPTGVWHESAVTDWGHGDACMADGRESGGGE
jgi:hypothetical protein